MQNGGSGAAFGESRRQSATTPTTQLVEDGRRARCWCRSGRDRRTVSARRWSSTAVAGWPQWHDLPGEAAPGRDNDQLPVTGAHCEGTAVSLLKNAQDVGEHLAATSGKGRRHRITTRWPTSAGVSRTSSR